MRKRERQRRNRSLRRYDLGSDAEQQWACDAQRNLKDTIHCTNIFGNNAENKEQRAIEIDRVSVIICMLFVVARGGVPCVPMIEIRP